MVKQNARETETVQDEETSIKIEISILKLMRIILKTEKISLEEMEWMKFVKWYPRKFPELNDMPFKNDSMETEKKHDTKQNYTKFHNLKKNEPWSLSGKKNRPYTKN